MGIVNDILSPVRSILSGVRNDMQIQANALSSQILSIAPLGSDITNMAVGIQNLANNAQTTYMNTLNMIDVTRNDISGIGGGISALGGQISKLATTGDIVGAIEGAFMAVDDTVGAVAQQAATQALAGLGDAIMSSGLIPFFEDQTNQLMKDIVATGMADQLGLEEKFVNWAKDLSDKQLQSMELWASALTSDIGKQIQQSGANLYLQAADLNAQVRDEMISKMIDHSDLLVNAIESRIGVLGESLSSEMSFLNKSMLSSFTDNELVGEALGYGEQGLGYAAGGAGMVLSAGEQALKKLEGLADGLTKYLPLVIMGVVALMIVKK